MSSRRWKLRPLEAIPTDHGGQRVLMLRDPLHISDAVLLVPISLAPVLERLDGRHTLEGVRERCASLHGLEISEETCREVVSRLEEARFLEGTAFRPGAPR